MLTAVSKKRISTDQEMKAKIIGRSVGHKMTVKNEEETHKEINRCQKTNY